MEHIGHETHRFENRQSNFRSDDRFECKHCFNSGFRYVEDPKGRVGPDGKVYMGVVRCGECNSSYFHRQGLND